MGRMSDLHLEQSDAYWDYHSDLYEYEQYCVEQQEMYLLGKKVYQPTDEEQEAYEEYMKGGIKWDGTSERNVHSNIDMNSKDGQLIALRTRRNRSLLK